MKSAITLVACATLLTACASPAEKPDSATAVLQPKSGSQVRGEIRFTQIGNRVRVSGEVTGHTAGKKGFHLHEKGDCSTPDAMSAGGHFNPAKAKHGGPGSGHAGDLGNLVFDQNGRAVVNMTVDGITVSRDVATGIIGRSVVIHAAEDDLKTDPTGNSGGRVACGVIE